MPTRKTSAAPKAASKTVKTAPKTVPAQHSHAELEAELVALKQEVEALKGQCRSCCADLAELRVQASKSQDSDLDRIISILRHAPTYEAFRKKLRS